jgi:hypothetical protein
MLFYRAAVIEEALGRPDEARRLLQAMHDTDPTFDDRARSVLGVGL